MKELYVFPTNDYRSFLLHHGIKGQKWGVRNAEWYPIADWQAHLSRGIGNKLVSYSTSTSKRDIERAKKVLIGMGIGLATAGLAYAYVNGAVNVNADYVIKAGSQIQRIAHSGDKNLHDMYYGSNRKLDNLKYRALFAGQIQADGDDAFIKKSSPLKI